MRAGDHREFAARNIAPNRLHGDIAVAQNDPRQGFNLNIRHRGTLRLGKAADLRLGKLDVFHIAGRYFLHCGQNFAVSQAELRGRIFVKLGRKVADGSIAARLNIGQSRLHDCAGLGVILGALGFGFAVL